MDTFMRRRTLRNGFPEFSGPLFKEGHMFRRKKEVWARLSGSCLYFYNLSPEEMTALQQSEPGPMVEPDDTNYDKDIQVIKCVKGSRKNEIVIVDEDRHSCSIFVPTDDEFEPWLRMLQEASQARIEIYYEFGQVLGKGAYGVVRMGRCLRTKELVAIKIMDKTSLKEKDFRLLKREMLIVHHLQHPNIVSTLDIFDSRDTLHVVMELMHGGMLYDVISAQGRFQEHHAAQAMADLFESLKYLHAHNIMHRDLKPENLLCSSNKFPYGVKLADFGFAKFIDSVEEYALGSAVGTPYYVSPEVVRKSPYGTGCDMWSCGVILYNLLSGKQPFAGANKNEVLKKIKAVDYSFPDEYWSSISPQATSLIRGLLQLDPNKRLSAQGALHHEWITSQLRMGETAVNSQDDLVERVKTLRHSRASEGRFRWAAQVVITLGRISNSPIFVEEDKDEIDEKQRQQCKAIDGMLIDGMNTAGPKCQKVPVASGGVGPQRSLSEEPDTLLMHGVSTTPTSARHESAVSFAPSQKAQLGKATMLRKFGSVGKEVSLKDRILGRENK
ncbi:Myosin light chain kinase A [Porphyridium purpureum]|uniref:Myosin light chain kinase A n=1 Tax=Porphyridium purpureum TaxID=35688 RepID=A0A5J4YS94_PORPP|nr:Myosin light chain kinase A [Porphyridium purpureum]|eukprot:POR1140..scf236_6